MSVNETISQAREKPPRTQAESQVALIGASNVTIGFAPIIRLLRGGFPEPLDVRTAIGHGRSYGTWSRFGGRSLPGIIDCGLWRTLEASEAHHRYGLLTDIGNDLLYGRTPEQIADWVERCLDRLLALNARCILTRLPLARIERLSASRYHATRLLFFPGHRPIRWGQMLDRVRDLDERLAQFAKSGNVPIFTPPDDWYGVDPIHIRRGIRPTAWREVFSAWPGFDGTGPSRKPAMRLLGRFPEEYRILGWARTSRQPVWERDGLSLSLY